MIKLKKSQKYLIQNLEIGDENRIREATTSEEEIMIVNIIEVAMGGWQ